MTLQDQLRSLADDVDRAPHVDTAAQARHRAESYRRRGRVVTAVTAVAVLTLTGSVVGLAELASHREAAPADGGSVGLHAGVYEPSGWLPGTDEAGQLGRVAVVIETSRSSWWGTEPGVVGVSAETGVYRFLDLPRYAGGVALSPDGTRVAYWATGTTREDPLTEDRGRAVGAVASYDTGTGEVVIEDIPSDHGLAVDSLAWSGSDRLLLSYGFHRGGDDSPTNAQSSSTTPALHLWRPADGLMARMARDAGVVTASPTAAVVVGTGSGTQVLSLPRCLPRCVVEALPRQGGQVHGASPLLDASGTRTAATARGRSPSGVTIRMQGRTEVARGSRRTFEVLSWLGPSRLLVRQHTDGRLLYSPDLRVLDLRTGQSVLTVRLPRDIGLRTTRAQIAVGLADRPTFEAPEPPRTLDPRLVTGLSIVILLSGAASLLLWRRRARI